MTYLGDFKYGQTVYCPFASYSGSTGASITLTGLAVTDIEIYKNASMTQRSSDAGYTLLDTDGIDLDSTTGIHGFTIDTSDNTVASFYSPNAEYTVIVSSVTVDTQTVNFFFQFSIENRSDDRVLVRTSIATLTSQTSFTITAGSVDDNTYVGSTVIVQDAASVVQKAVGTVSAYTGSTKTVTLGADPAIFTMAVGDYVTIVAGRSTFTSTERNNLADAIFARSLGTESYATDGTVPTFAQMLFMLHSEIAQFDITSTTITARKLDGSTSSMTFTLDSATNPTSRTRAT